MQNRQAPRSNNKSELRKIIREQKKRHSIEELTILSQKIVSTLMDDIRKHDFQVVLLYHSLPDEVCTHSLLDTLLKMGKTVLLPTIVGDDLELHEYIGSHAVTASVAYGIQESTGAQFTDYQQIDLAVVPGMAFTPSGNRLGRGKGFYDRLLPKLQCPLIGLAFPFQMVDSIPCESHDVKMTKVIW